VRGFLSILLAPASRARLALFALSGAVAVALGYVLVKPIEAGHLIISWGYYYIFGVFAAFVYWAIRLLKSREEVIRGWLRRPGWPGVAILAGLLFAVWAEPFKHKILFDEFVIQGTAYQMHVTKEVSTILRAYTIHGTWLPIDLFLDKRPYFFPFLVSLVHDLTGYRIANMFFVNVACAATLLSLLYWFTRQVAGRAPAILAVLLMATLPLFAQNATGAGMDIHNLTMMALVACLGTLYLRSPSDDRLTVLVLGAILLTESRYESVIFVAPVAFIVLLGWARAGRVLLPWPVIVAPLLFIPYAWHSRVLASEPIFWQLQEGQTSAFGWSNIANNVRGDVHYLFNTGVALSNSWYLTIVGLIGLGWFLFQAARRLAVGGGGRLAASTVVGAAFGLGITVHFCVLLLYWWARFDDALASRFALPMCLAFSVLAAVLARDLAERRIPGVKILAAGLCIWLLTGGFPAMARRLYTDENLVMQELDWEHEIVAKRPGPVLVISNRSTIPFILWHIPAIISAVGATRGEEIRYHLGQGTFKDVIVFQLVRPSTVNGDYGIDPNDLMPPSYHLETLAEKRFGANLARISRIVSIDPAPPDEKKGPQRPLAPTPLRLISAIQSFSDPSVAAETSAASSR
jgi:Flp pilus assembly protein protease CpaA